MSGRRPRLVAAAVLAAAFVAGAVVGAAGYRYLGPGASARAAGGDTPRETERGREARFGEREGRDGHGRNGGERDGGPTSAMLEILREEVGISAGREEEVRAILERREERAHRIFEDVRGRFHRWMDTTVAEVQTVLDEEQAAEFERRFEERLQRWRRKREERHGPSDADSASRRSDSDRPMPVGDSAPVSSRGPRP